MSRQTYLQAIKPLVLARASLLAHQTPDGETPLEVQALDNAYAHTIDRIHELYHPRTNLEAVEQTAGALAAALPDMPDDIELFGPDERRAVWDFIRWSEENRGGNNENNETNETNEP